MTQIANTTKQSKPQNARSKRKQATGKDTKTVAKGDSLSSIAKNAGVSLDDLLRVNPQIKNPDLIHPGQAIHLPAHSSSASGAQGAKPSESAKQREHSKFETKDKNPFGSDEPTNVTNASQKPSKTRKSMNFAPSTAKEPPKTASREGETKKTGIEDAVQSTMTTASENIDKTVQEKKEASQSILNRLPNQIRKNLGVAEGVVRSIEEGVSNISDAAQSSERAFKNALSKGKAPHEALQAGIGAAGQSLYNNTVDRWLDQSVLGPDSAANDQATGALGPLLTNRLGVGESVNIDLARGNTLPTMLLGAPNVTLEEGGKLSMKRVAALDENNKAIIDPKTGKPETRLEVELEMRGRVAGDYRAEVGFEAKGKALGHEAGVEAKATAKLEAGAIGRAGIRMRIDPNNPEEMNRLSGLIGVAQGMQPGSKLPANMNGISDNVEAIYGEGGLYTQATASASARAGIFEVKKDTKESSAGTNNATSKSALKNLGEQAKAKTKKELDQYHTDLVKLAQFDVAGASASIGGHLKIGRNENFRTNESSLTFEIGGRAGASASILGFGGGKKSELTKKVEMVYDKNGQLSNLYMKEKMTKEDFLASRSELESLYGKTITDGFLAKLDKSKSVEIRYDVKPEALAELQQSLGNKDASKSLQFANAFFDGKMKRANFKINPTGITATESQNATIQGKLGISILAKLGLSGILSLGHSQEYTPNQ